jgi:hypothetical protein
MLASSLLSPNFYIENSLVTEHTPCLKKDHFRIWSSLFIDTLILTLFYFSLKGITVSNIFRIGAVFCFLDLAKSFYVRRKFENLRFSIVKSVFLIRSYLIISSRPTSSAFFHKEKIQINAEAQVLACVDSSMICLFLNMHTVVQYNVDCLYMKTCEPQLLNLSS